MTGPVFPIIALLSSENIFFIIKIEKIKITNKRPPLVKSSRNFRFDFGNTSFSLEDSITLFLCSFSKGWDIIVGLAVPRKESSCSNARTESPPISSEYALKNNLR